MEAIGCALRWRNKRILQPRDRRPRVGTDLSLWLSNDGVMDPQLVAARLADVVVPTYFGPQGEFRREEVGHAPLLRFGSADGLCTVVVRPQVVHVTLDKWWWTFAEKPCERADVRAAAYSLARAFGSTEARYAPDDDFSEGLLGYVFELGLDDPHYAPAPDWERGIELARHGGALADARRDDHAQHRALWLDDFSDFEALHGSVTERARAMRTFGRLGIDPANLRPLASASGRLRLPDRYWRRRDGASSTGSHGHESFRSEPVTERLELLERAAVEAPGVGSDELLALDALATHLDEPLVVFGFTSDVAAHLLGPSDRIAAIQRDGTPIVLVTADDSTHPTFDAEMAGAVPTFDILVDVHDPDAAARVASTVRDAAMMRFFARAADRQRLGRRDGNCVSSTIHVRTRDGIRTERAT